MRTSFTSFFLFFAFLFALPLFAADTIKGKVISVADGDTITVLENKTQIKVRLHGVDAPEKAQDFGSVSRTFTSDLCFGKEVSVEVTDTDRYGRKVGIVTLPDGRVLNHELVEAGLAHWYVEYAPDDTALQKLQKEAKAAKRGLWSRDDAIPPWQFRKGKRTPDSGGEVSPTPPTSNLRSTPQRKADGDVYITETGTKYHRASCHNLKNSRMSISLDKAKEKGFAPCGTCFKR